MLRSLAGRRFAIRTGVRLSVPLGDDVQDIARLNARLDRYPRDTPVWLSLPAPPDADGAAAWRTRLDRLLTAAARRAMVIEIRADGAAPDVASFALRATAARARAVNGRIRVALGIEERVDETRLRALYTRDIAPAVDLLMIDAFTDVEAAAAVLADVDPSAALASHGRVGDESTHQATVQCREQVLWKLGGTVSTFVWAGLPAMLDSCLTSLAPASELMAGDLVPVDPAAAGLAFRIDGKEPAHVPQAQLLFDQARQSTWLLYRGGSGPGAVAPLEIQIHLSADGRPTVIDFQAGTPAVALGGERDAATGLLRLRVPRTPPVGKTMIVAFNEGETAGFIDRAGVTAARRLTVEEIVARHQQQQAAQDALVENYIASARTEQHFRPTIADSGYDVVSDNVYFVDRDGIEWEERSFSVNGSRWGADRPEFPMLQPEKVLSLPLALRFGDDYRYRLAGESTVDGVACYEVAFEPVHSDRSLYKGTLWIDRQTFALVKLDAVQTQLGAPVVSNAETHTYRTVTTIDGRPIVLLSQLVARQIVMIAGRNILLEKRAAFDGFRVNAADFAARRQAARASDRIMFRETDRGLRYYTRQGDTRVVSERGTARAKAMAMGVLIDPSYRFPLPLGGINYLNFEVGGRQDTQFALLFAGVLAAGNLQRPKVGRTPFDLSFDFFAIATPAWDRLFDYGRSRDAESLLTWPLTSSVNLGWQANAFMKLSAQYQFRFDGFARDSTTAESFVVPSSTVTHGTGAAWEYRRGGYSVVVNGTLFNRAGWKPWGAADALQGEDESPARYAKYSAVASRDFHIDAFQKLHVDAGLFGGHDLDRFSRYQFGMFDETRIHGVPASGIRFDELRMLRGSYSFNIFEQYRLDLFLEQAWGRDRPAGPDWRPLTGTGVGVNMRAPWRTMLRVDFGHSFLPDRYSGLGSTTLQVMVLKPLR